MCKTLSCFSLSLAWIVACGGISPYHMPFIGASTWEVTTVFSETETVPKLSLVSSERWKDT